MLTALWYYFPIIAEETSSECTDFKKNGPVGIVNPLSSTNQEKTSNENLL